MAAVCAGCGVATHRLRDRRGRHGAAEWVGVRNNTSTACVPWCGMMSGVALLQWLPLGQWIVCTSHVVRSFVRTSARLRCQEACASVDAGKQGL